METQEQKRITQVGHNSQETAYIINNYPWGFRFKTQQRRWVETNPKHGQRLIIQTMDPKNGRWCAPKKETFAFLVVIYTEGDKCFTDKLSIYEAGDSERLESFASRYTLDDWQKARVEEMRNTIKRYNAIKQEREHNGKTV